MIRATMTSFPHIADHLTEIRAEIAKAAKSAERAVAGVTLIAVSKTHPVEAVEAALTAGQRVFGENRVQEALEKFPRLREKHPDLELHLIGPLQSNKARDAVQHCDVIQSLDRDKLAEVLAAEMAKQNRRPKLFIQVNTGEEPQKAGIAPGNVDAFVAHCRDTLQLPLVGLMCIPPVDQHPAPHFALLGKIAARNGLTGLSMGMSGDFVSAIQCGATHVRIGTAIFGKRG